MSIAEGNGTVGDVAASAPQEPVENKMEAAMELAPPYQPAAQVQQPPTQVVVVPNAVRQTVQATTYTTANQATGYVVGGSVMANNNLNYYTPRLEDTRNYEENMKPWETDGQNYSFACCTEKQATQLTADKRSSSVSVVDWVHSVYHKTGSTRLIIKRKAGSSALAQAKNNPVTKWAIFIFLCGVVCLSIGISASSEEDDNDSDSNTNSGSVTGSVYDGDNGDEDEDEGGSGPALIGGGAVLMLAAFVLFCCYQKRKVVQRNYDLVTQSIPINSIFFVERAVQQREQADQCCCEKAVEQETSHTDISIGYNRSNLSTHLKFGASTEDHITFSLDSNQAYNLHQYINCIIDGSHPQTNGNVVINAGGGDVLPRASTFKAA